MSSESVVTVVRDEQQQWKSEVAEFRAGKGDTGRQVEGLVWVKVEEAGGEGTLNVMSISDMDLFTAFSGITYDLSLHDSLQI